MRLCTFYGMGAIEMNNLLYSDSSFVVFSIHGHLISLKFYDCYNLENLKAQGRFEKIYNTFEWTECFHQGLVLHQYYSCIYYFNYLYVVFLHQWWNDEIHKNINNDKLYIYISWIISVPCIRPETDPRLSETNPTHLIPSYYRTLVQQVRGLLLSWPCRLQPTPCWCYWLH